MNADNLTSIPVRHSYITDSQLQNTIFEKGFCVLDALDSSEIESLKALYHERHDLKETGMFYSLYSKDLTYRREIYDRIAQILTPFLATNFHGHQLLYNIFILKAPGKESKFFVHQEPSMMDESRFSPLHIWIPLEDITEQNGAVCLVEKTHYLHSPQRGISFPAVFDQIQSTVQHYMTPIYMKAGQVLVFDPRLIHFSLPNFSDHTRAAVLCGLAPAEAEIIIAHREPDINAPIELIQQERDFFLTSDDFYLNCKCRPETGTFIKHSDYTPYSLSAEAFEKFCQDNNIVRKDLLPPFEDIDCIMYGEPIQEMNKYNSKTYVPESM